MAPVNCLQFSYLGTMRYVICDLDKRYEQIQGLVAKTYGLPEEFISAIQFTDGKGYIFSKEIFEYFILLFPQPEQKFYIRLEYGKILQNRLACKEGKFAPFGIVNNNNSNKRSRQETNNGAAPVRRMNCFLGSMPDGSNGDEDDEETEFLSQPKKRMRLMKSIKKSTNKIKRPHTKRVLRI